LANPNVPTNLFPFNNSAWKRMEVKATVSDPDGNTVKLVVTFSKSATFSTGVYTSQSALVASGSTVTVTLSGATFTSGDLWYYKVKATDSTGASSADSAVYNFTYKPSGLFAPDGTPFMQQGDPAIHEKIIDVSEYQGTIDWAAVKSSGINYSYLRAYGSSRTANNGNGDLQFENNVTASKAAGVKTGGYFFAMPVVPFDISQARTEADLFIAKLQAGYGAGQYGDLMPILDVEDNAASAAAGATIFDLSVENMLQWVNEFRNYFEQQTGRTLGLYTGDYFVRDQRNNFNYDDATGQPVAGTSGNIIQDMPLWIQGYDNYDRYKGDVMPSSGGWTKWYIFQYSESGTQVGITGNVDQNFIVHADYIQPPKDVTGVAANDDGTNVTITWNANTEIDIQGYYLYLDGVLQDYIVGASNTSYTFTNVTKGVSHTFGVKARDLFDDDSLNSANVSRTVNAVTLPEPKVTIVSVSHTKISDEAGMNTADITFTFDIDTTAFTVNVNGVSYDSGVVAHSGGGKSVADLSTMTVLDLSSSTVQQVSVIAAGYEIVAEIDWTELYAEGDNRVNIYGKNTDGVWSSYNQQ